MRYAVFTSSANGLILADKIRNNMSAVVDIYCHENMPAREDVHSYSRLSTLLKDIFNKYSGLIFIMATGIVVRTIAPLLESKLTDPAVVVMDEKGQNIISLLSGHVGGANDLTLKLARKLGTQLLLRLRISIISWHRMWWHPSWGCIPSQRKVFRF